MASAPAKEKIVTALASVSKDLNELEGNAFKLRRKRDELFVKAYDARACSVTEMAKISGLRRESVHAAINRTKEGA